MFMRVFSVKFYFVFIILVKKIVFSLVYNEIRDEIIIGIVGGIMIWKFFVG